MHVFSKEFMVILEVNGVKVAVHAPHGASGPYHCVIINIHGGGWVNGSMYSVAPLSQSLATQIGCVVVGVDYGLGMVDLAGLVDYLVLVALLGCSYS